MSDVAVAMSGGVDSSVAAAIMLEAGHRVTGVTMRLCAPAGADGESAGSDPVSDAGQVCKALGIPHVIVEMSEEFERDVVGRFAAAYSEGVTPNPCVSCNDKVKFGSLLRFVREGGWDMLATGHYARIVRDAEGHAWLARGVDRAKDQSYFLYTLDEVRLDRVLFPIGQMEKSSVRAFAQRLGLPVASKSESQDTCFSAGGYDEVVRARAPQAFRPGDIVDAGGRVLGRHPGIGHYTVGQRKGLGVGGLAEPLRVVGIDAEGNRVIVGPRDELQMCFVVARTAVWRGERIEDCEVALRYRMDPVPAIVEARGRQLEIALSEPVEGVAPGQSAVCYRGDTVIGGGVIECAS